MIPGKVYVQRPQVRVVGADTVGYWVEVEVWLGGGRFGKVWRRFGHWDYLCKARWVANGIADALKMEGGGDAG